MNDHELDEQLKQGKKQADGFFEGSRVDGLRKSLIRGLSHYDSKKKKVRKPSGAILSLIAASAAVFLCALVFMSPFTQKLDFGQSTPAGTESAVEPSKGGQAVLEQSLALGSGEHSVSFHPLETSQTDEPSLLSVLWEDNGGTPEMVHNDVFEKSDTPYPTSIVPYPGGSRSKLILLSSGSSAHSYMHYRLIEYSTGSINTLWSQDFVPSGQLGVMDGIVVEQRVSGSSGGYGLIVSYMIPYMVRDGSISLPIDALSVHVGDVVIFVGEDGMPINAQPENGIAHSLDDVGDDQVKAFVADTAGDEVLLLSSENEKDSELFLTVQDR